MDLHFTPDGTAHLVSHSQRARVLTEAWVAREVACPSCGASPLLKHPPNNPAADFCCPACREQYELKSIGRRHGRTIPGGAYQTMLGRVRSGENVNLVLLSYSRTRLQVTDLEVIPKQFITPNVIMARPPLGPTARRAGWVGCKILLHDVPTSGRISLLRNQVVEDPRHVRAQWARVTFVRERGAEGRGWLVATMRCIDTLATARFTLSDLYRMAPHLRNIFPNNHNIEAKIRQQLQILRERGYLRFLGQGHYEVSELSWPASVAHESDAGSIEPQSSPSFTPASRS